MNTGRDGRIPENVITVSELNSYICDKLDSDPKLSLIYIKGEVANLTISSNNHLFFSLKDEDSKISCVIFSKRRESIEHDLREGEEVVVAGEVKHYKRDGRCNLFPVGVLPVGDGVYYRRLNELREKLKSEGLFDDQYKKPIPELSEKIGIVTSKDGDALRDMVNAIYSKFPDVDIHIKHSAVQGDNAAKEICEGIEFFDERFEVDVILVGRGGGSIEDLQQFNEEEVARTIFNARTPVISGVGHKEDETITKFVADYGAITPTEAGKKAVQDKSLLEEKLGKLENNLDNSFAKFKRIKEQGAKIAEQEKKVKEAEKLEEEVEGVKRLEFKYKVVISILILVVVVLLIILLGIL